MEDSKLTALVEATEIVDTDILYVVQDVSGTPDQKRVQASTAKSYFRASKNILQNGGFQVAQRGAGPFTAATAFVNSDDKYLLDGCVLLSDGNDIVDVSQVVDTDFVSGYKIRLDVETANKKFGILLPVQRNDIQDIRKSQKASLQFKVKCTGVSMSNIRAQLISWSGTADTITSDAVNAWGAAGATPTLVANWTAENVADNIPITTTIATHKIENITVDTASVANLAVLITLDDTDATAGDFLEIGDFKLEEGEICTTYVNNMYQDDLCKCLNRFELRAGGTGLSIAAGLADSTSAMTAFLKYTARKAAVPAPAFGFGTAVGDFSIRYTGSGVTVVTSLASAVVGLDDCNIAAAGTGTPLTAGQAVNLRLVNANAYITISSEL